MAKKNQFLLTCEHGGNKIPAPYRRLFKNCDALLQSHRGYDEGALVMAKQLAKVLGFPLVSSTVSRLLIDLNRSRYNPNLYSEITRAVSPDIRHAILNKYYLPYREQVETIVTQAVRRGNRLIHISCHTFVPALDGEVRNADIGLLYDPSRSTETAFCRSWQKKLKADAPELKVRRNYPYAGKSDGIAAHLRKQFSNEAYVGIELEVNQRHVLGNEEHWRDVRGIVMKSLHAISGER